MQTPEALRRDVKALAFDQYGTIVDMQNGLTEAVAPFLERKGWHGKPTSFVTWWRRTHFENSMIDALCDRGHTPYRQIGERAVSYVMDRCGIRYTPEEARWLVSEIEKLKPFPDVVPALEKLRKTYKLAILSNGDPDMLEGREDVLAALLEAGMQLTNLMNELAEHRRKHPADDLTTALVHNDLGEDMLAPRNPVHTSSTIATSLAHE